MGRELRRKQAKKDGKSLEKDEIIETHQINNFIINVIAVVGIVAIIYLISGLFITKEIKWFSKDKESSTDTEKDSVTNTILASAIFKQSEEEYYVYFYDFNEEEKDSTITNHINNTLYNDKVYKVNTSSALNANYVSEKGNKSAKKLEDLKVVNHTLIKISGETITEYYEADEITDKIK